MQDRFKYRAWDKNLKIMRPVWSVTPFGAVVTDLKTENRRLPFKDCKIMQCTGLKDKHGKLIYEGDIVKNFHVSSTMQPNIFIGEVKYCQEQGYWRTENDVSCVNFFDTDDIYEVLGNVYESPELLENN